MTGSLHDRVGLVLAGGYSTRFGPREKALAPVDGVPMLRRIVDGIQPVTDAVVVNCRAEQRASFARVLSDSDASVAFAIDPVDGMGPLAGVRAGLAVHDAAETVLLACDQPRVDADVLRSLRDAGGNAEAVAVRSEGHLQPTPALLSTRAARRAATDAQSAARRALTALFERLDVRAIEDSRIEADTAVDHLLDVDRPRDLPEP